MAELQLLAGRFDDALMYITLAREQLQVLKMMREGMQNRQIAMVLGVSVSAVKRHMEVLFKVLNVNNRTACVQAAVKQNLI